MMCGLKRLPISESYCPLNCPLNIYITMHSLGYYEILQDALVSKSSGKSFIILLSVMEPGTILRISHILTNVIFTDVLYL